MFNKQPLLVSITALSLTLGAQAVYAQYENDVQEAYIAYYGRPADYTGLSYWDEQLASANGNLSMVIGSFGASAEYEARYGALDNSQLIDAVYRQLFNRDPEPAGKAFWVAALDSGLFNRQNATLAILLNAQGADGEIVANKVAVASAYTENLSTQCGAYGDIDEVVARLATVGLSSESMASAQAQLIAYSDSVTPALSFCPTPFPYSDAQKRAILASPAVRVNGVVSPIGYTTILRSGDTAGSGVFGQLVDIHGQVIREEDGSPRISNSNDFSSFIPVGDKLYMVSQFEDRPGAMYLSELDQADTGHISALSTHFIDQSSIHGGWVHCAGSVTPWNTHLGSEEYEPDARLFNFTTGTKITGSGQEDTYFHAMDAYFDGNRLAMDPYFWGYPIEVDVLNDSGETSITKHYGMGRMALELAKVMPDQRTAYMSDDGTNVGMFMFVADTAGDLSAGTLYGAKLTQTSPDDDANGGVFTIEWIKLGQSSDAEISALVDAKTTFDQIFTTADPVVDADGKDTGACPTGFTSVNHGHEATEGNTYHECLQLKSGMEKAATFLETRRYAAMMGVTTELSKEEGIAFDPANKKLYVSISDIRYGMENDKKKGVDNTTYDIGGPNDVRVAWNPCGGVYQYSLGSDTTIGSDYVVKDMSALVLGDPNSGTDENNTCNIDGIANPDNITYIPGYRTLIIGEDTGSGHQNDSIWAYNLDHRSLTRIQTTPYGSETTSPYFYANVGGHGYIMSVVQHPYGESDSDKQVTADEGRAYTGYIGPLPRLDQ
ncbi:MAG: DUF839 domain-containing protein [Candidatus Competibacteraceae bacterium]|nr:DUF839 domain-containing protein [Candidatus Competibacteraceae bacterium]MCP5124848.1 DUF839 domain-containing protein [Gammaproteobacteria bacterium]